MLKLTQVPTPKQMWRRIFNFIIIVLLVIVAPGFLGIASVQQNAWLQLFWALMMFLAYAAIGYYAFRLLKATTHGKVFHRPNIRNWQHMWYIIGIFVFMIVIEIIISALRIKFTGVTTTENQTAIQNLTEHLNVTMVAMVIYGVVLAPVVEEIIFRGLVINYFFRHSWWWASIILSGVLFAFPHMGAVPTNLADVLSYLIYMVMGMVMAYVYKKTGNLQDSIAIHFINNAVTMLPVLVIVIFKALS
ncbi:CPBP family intramembrane glutamic endopeptidase [Leuconostoc rapi]|uniref:CPBP family intramembrane glutamic endopeptidase n=1 Tax=Leuconostoc rapi TaxID=1406906 RepID=UPI001959DC97|nr:type II CAAX endopeptidase family protein [Leuconostoc rapi]MBM7434724.1 membrane protease YdiL (CAAX protease family) [Leuconostoc rapi]